LTEAEAVENGNGIYTGAAGAETAAAVVESVDTARLQLLLEL